VWASKKMLPEVEITEQMHQIVSAVWNSIRSVIGSPEQSTAQK
jgi:hypothetical protein